jgi:hypothetical protein
MPAGLIPVGLSTAPIGRPRRCHLHLRELRRHIRYLERDGVELSEAPQGPIELVVPIHRRRVVLVLLGALCFCQLFVVRVLSDGADRLERLLVTWIRVQRLQVRQCRLVVAAGLVEILSLPVRAARVTRSEEQERHPDDKGLGGAMHRPFVWASGGAGSGVHVDVVRGHGLPHRHEARAARWP